MGLGPGRGPDFAGGQGTPSEVKAMSEPVAAVSCGGFFTMALTEGGQLWNWGGKSSIFCVVIVTSYKKPVPTDYLTIDMEEDLNQFFIGLFSLFLGC